MSVPQASLLVEDDTRRELALGGQPVLVGSGDVCTLRIKGNGCASFTHADIRLENGDWVLSDLGSRDGTRVNGVRVTRHVLRNADTVHIAGVRITFLRPEPEPAPAPAAAPSRLGDDTDRLPPLKLETFIAPDELRRERRDVLLLSIGGGTLLIAFLAMLPLFLADDKADPRKPIPWVQVKCEVGGFAFVTLQHTAVRVIDPGIASATSSGDARNQIVITGLAPGKTRLHADGTRGQLWEITVTVEPHEEWPPGWTDEDRMSAAEKLYAEALCCYQGRELPELHLIDTYYRLAKVCRLYRNCKFPPAAQFEEAGERVAELEKKITKRETEHMRELFRTFRTGDLALAQRHLNDLLALFPEDGDADHVMDAHGNSQKHQQYFLLGLKLEQMAKDLR